MWRDLAHRRVVGQFEGPVPGAEVFAGEHACAQICQ